MITVYEKPTRWYRREHSLSIPIWPQWLSQLLCNHRIIKINGHVEENNIFQKSLGSCADCYKNFEYQQKIPFGIYFMDNINWDIFLDLLGTKK